MLRVGVRMSRIISIILRIAGMLLPFIRTGERHRILSGIFMITVNVIPAIGVIFLGWNGAFILIVYWTETAIIGFFNVLRILISGFLYRSGTGTDPAIRVQGVVYSMFFPAHYGGFMFVHLLFLSILFFPDIPNEGDLFAMTTGVLLKVFLAQGFIASVAFIGLYHAWIFLRYFIMGKAYRSHQPSEFMVKPYGRIIVMQFSIILGGIAAMITGWSSGVVILWVVFKTLLDLRLFSGVDSKTGKMSGDAVLT